jgi:hypothetical protein
MGDTFEKMQDSKQESMTINRGQLVVEFIESTLAPEEIKEMQAAYRWLHSIQPRTWAAENGGAGGGDQWAGRIKAIRKLVEDQLQQGRRQSAGLAAQIEQVQGRQGVLQESVKSEIAGVSQRMEGRMETIESRLAEVIAMLQNLQPSKPTETDAGGD